MSINTLISVVLDRSGSMEDIRDDVIGGFNAFLAQQQVDGDHSTLTLVQFDSVDSYEVVHSFRPVRDVPALSAETYLPRGGTPLLDAMGRTMVNLRDWIARQADGSKPDKVLVVFITDGQENASHEYTRPQIVEMMKTREQESGWQFVFLSADLEAINEAGHLGVCHQRLMAFDKSSQGVREAFLSMSECVYQCRKAPDASFAFRPEHRAKQQLEQERS